MSYESDSNLGIGSYMDTALAAPQAPADTPAIAPTQTYVQEAQDKPLWWYLLVGGLVGVGFFVLFRKESRGNPARKDVLDIFDAMDARGMHPDNSGYASISTMALDEWEEHPSFSAAQAVQIAVDHHLKGHNAGTRHEGRRYKANPAPDVFDIGQALYERDIDVYSSKDEDIVNAAYAEWEKHPTFSAEKIVQIAVDGQRGGGRYKVNGPAADADWTLKHSKQALAEARRCARRRDWRCANSKGREAKALADEAWHKAPKSFLARKRIEKRAERQFTEANDFLWDARDTRRGTR